MTFLSSVKTAPSVDKAWAASGAPVRSAPAATSKRTTSTCPRPAAAWRGVGEPPEAPNPFAGAPASRSARTQPAKPRPAQCPTAAAKASAPGRAAIAFFRASSAFRSVFARSRVLTSFSAAARAPAGMLAEESSGISASMSRTFILLPATFAATSPSCRFAARVLAFTLAADFFLCFLSILSETVVAFVLGTTILLLYFPMASLRGADG
mmetsp:Transcript_22082/g.61890  ORF Transcript_22082/g.61890 Transcript_22082/m.61890 type:complete len:209 (+) Transcript_22082:109-735(+)